MTVTFIGVMEDALQELTQQAVEAALKNDWETAIKLNQEILAQDEESIETLNRLGRSYLENGNLNKAKATYKKVLVLDPYNPIAQKNLERLSALQANDLKKSSGNGVSLSPTLFLEEPGKTKVLKVENLVGGKLLATLGVGDVLEIVPFHNECKIVNNDNKALGILQEDWGRKIAKALRVGNKFSCVVKSVQVKGNAKDSILSVFVRETMHASKLPQPFFTTIPNSHFTPYVGEQTMTLLNHNEVHAKDEDELNEEETPHHAPKATESLESLAEQESEADDEDS